MDPHRDRILKDLSQTLLDRTIKAASEMALLCKLADIPQYEFDAAAEAVYLYLFMSLLSNNKPTTTPEEIGYIVQGQYKFFKKGLEG